MFFPLAERDDQLDDAIGNLVVEQGVEIVSQFFADHFIDDGIDERNIARFAAMIRDKPAQ